MAQNEASSQHALQPDASPSASSSGDNNPVILQASNEEPGSGTMQSSPSPAHPQLPILQTQVGQVGRLLMFLALWTAGSEVEIMWQVLASWVAGSGA